MERCQLDNSTVTSADESKQDNRRDDLSLFCISFYSLEPFDHSPCFQTLSHRVSILFLVIRLIMTERVDPHHTHRLPIPTYSLFHGLEVPESDRYCLLSGLGTHGERLPGHPQTKLIRDDLLTFLCQDFGTPNLDRFSPWLWLVATQDSSHISTLTHQIVRGREITVTEKPEMHLVWHDKRIFIKPIPPFLFSHVFWSALFSPDAGRTPDRHERSVVVHQALLGFMRTYFFLIEHPSDFSIAVGKGLIPTNCNGPSSEKKIGDESSESARTTQIDYASFVEYMECFGPEKVADTSMSGRYQYGDLRLGRLNFWAKFALGRFHFAKAYGNYDAYFSRFYGPVLFLFGVLSIVISSIQLGFASHAGVRTIQNSWKGLYRLGEGLSVTILVIVCIIGIALLALFVMMVSRETLFALRGLRKRQSVEKLVSSKV